MSGKLCNGLLTPTRALGKEWRAYNEGCQYRLSDVGTNVPKTNNPYTDAGDKNSKDAWDRGWDLAESFQASNITRDAAGCLGVRGQSVPPSTSG